MNFNLQRFADPVKGDKIIYLVRRYSKRTEEGAAVIALQTEGSRSLSKDADSVATKDGTIRVPGAGECEISVTSLVTNDDGIADDLTEAMEKNDLMEIWEVDTSKKASTPMQRSTRPATIRDTLRVWSCLPEQKTSLNSLRPTRSTAWAYPDG
ncbi:phage major tail protein, TP901-1 family [Allobaculum sp. Allo2]|uniref:phage major tail protein, TP901-1 family n=1 Tax=Allobaculum sp. Allo2 TaxID=2853432 RepID=UPI001F612277|nr:phage major tail protein, TP901-1 family [Allobaculum sp. Allo2]UNT92240.1 phage major tail protein, TP901-1 family [Allobaculum sp. Allo2]